MEHNHTFSPRDLLLAYKWSSLLFTTYSISLSFLEAVILPAVSRSFHSFTVLADLEGYRSSLADTGAIGVGRNYDVVPIRVKEGVFHSKIAVLEAEDHTVRATVGSGNLTFGGWGYNTEVLDVLVPGTDSNCFADMAGFFQAISDSAVSGGRLDAERVPDLGRFIETCVRASRTPGASNSRLLHTMAEPLDTQLRRMADDLGGATSLTVVSPFFSAHHGVKQLATALSCETISVAVPPVAPSIFDFASCREAGLSVSPVACDLFSDTRSLHAKLFDIECRHGRIVVAGSANATTAAMSGRNVEAVVARIVDNASSLGWRASGTHEGYATNEPPPEEAAPGLCLVAHFDGQRIVGRVFGLADPEGEWLGLLSSGTRREAAELVMVDKAGNFCFSPPKAMDPIALPTSAQAILERDVIEARGWLVLQELLHAVQEKGPIARSVSRMLISARI